MDDIDALSTALVMKANTLFTVIDEPYGHERSWQLVNELIETLESIKHWLWTSDER